MTWLLIVLLFGGLAGFWWVLSWDVETDFADWLAAREIRHRYELVERMYRLVPSWIALAFTLFYRMASGGYPVPATVVIGLGLPALMMGVVYMTLFDGLYNRKRGFGWWFNGSPHGKADDSEFDRFWRTVSDGFEKTIKIGFSILCVLLYAFFCLIPYAND